MPKTIFFLSIIMLVAIQSLAIEYEKQFENDRVIIARVKIAPGEVIPEHYDKLPAVVTALQGGVITRLEADGSTIDVEFPTGKGIYRPSEPEIKKHKSINNGNQPIELIIVELK